MVKFQRLYRIVIGIPYSNEAVVIQSPLTAHIHIDRRPTAILSTCDISIFGLSRQTRDLVFKDINAGTIYMPITVEAGYDNNMTLIFSGHIMFAYSEREQVKDVVTKIHAYDGGFDLVNAVSNRTIAKGTGLDTIIKSLESDFVYSVHGEIGSIATTEPRVRGTTIMGNTFKALNRYSDGKTIIDGGKVYTLADNEVVEGDITLINSSTGLLGTPQKQDTMLVADVLFEPRLVLQQIVEIQSEIVPLYNGQYKISGIVHDIHISEVECGNAKTQITAILPRLVVNQAQSFNLVQNNIVTPVNGLNSPIDGDVQDVWDYINKNGHPPTWRVTNSLLWSQMLNNFRGNNAFHSPTEMPTVQQLQNLKATAQLLQSTVDNNFQGASIIVNSGWRSSTGLYHIQGKAVDFTLSGYTNSYIQQKLIPNWTKGLGYAPNHTHIDNRSYKYIFKEQ